MWLIENRSYYETFCSSAKPKHSKVYVCSVALCFSAKLPQRRFRRARDNICHFCMRRHDKFVCNPRRAVQTHYSLRLSVLGMMTVINCLGGFCGFPKEKLLFSDAEFILNMSSNFTINYLRRHCNDKRDPIFYTKIARTPDSGQHCTVVDPCNLSPLFFVRYYSINQGFA
jgi:hypothetical protein